MARKKTETSLDSTALAPIHPAIAEDMAASGEWILAAQAQQETAQQLAVSLGYDGEPSNEELLATLRTGLRHTAEMVLSMGRAALMLKMRLPRGQFCAELDKIGVPRRAAAKFMQAAAKFAHSGDKLAMLPGMSQTKLLELVLLDDEDVNLLADTGELPGLPADAIESMSVSELKAALREREAKLNAKDKVAADTQKTIQRLQEEIHGKKPPSAEFLAEAALRDIDRHATDIVVLLEAELRRTFVAAQDHEASTGAALLKQAMEAAVGKVLAATKHLIEDFDIHTAELVPAVSQEDAEDQAIWAAVHQAAGTGQSHVAGE